MATIRNLVVDQGSDFSVTLDVSDANGTPLDLTNYTFRGYVKKTYASKTYLEFTVDSSMKASGELTLSLTAAQTALLKMGRYVYSAEIIDIDDVVTRITEGIITVNPGVFKAEGDTALDA